MSLKLGNTNIAGTQILYSTTGNNTDGAMTQAATTTELNNCVHKTGNETISGEKTTTAKIEMQSTNGSTSPVLLFHIPNVRYSRLIETSDGLTVQEGSGTTLDRLYAGSSDAVNTVVTTVNKSKTENGYFKLGNGLIIQWGRATSKTWNFPIPFSSNTSFSLVFNNNAGTDGYGRADTTASLTSTSVTAQGLCETPIRWLAIGY